MPSTSWAQKVVPYGADQTVYFVIDRFGKFSSVHREAEVERTDLETVITDLMSGQFSDPIRVVAFNTLEHWSEDVSNDIALEIQNRCDIEGLCSTRAYLMAHEGINPLVHPPTFPNRQARTCRSNQTSWLPKVIGALCQLRGCSFVATTMCRAWSYSVKWREAHLMSCSDRLQFSLQSNLSIA
jgi:hypothetical protein